MRDQREWDETDEEAAREGQAVKTMATRPQIVHPGIYSTHRGKGIRPASPPLGSRLPRRKN